ncbi:MAG: hypothetical protein GY737_18680 [Desulfobacteraceae bacterium]|nr:hypothetical protein [Desulfobacteraceae bacterium]
MSLNTCFKNLYFHALVKELALADLQIDDRSPEPVDDFEELMLVADEIDVDCAFFTMGTALGHAAHTLHDFVTFYCPFEGVRQINCPHCKALVVTCARTKADEINALDW